MHSKRHLDDRRAHFLTMLGDACMAAGVADISVDLVLSDGTRLTGTPSPTPADGHPPLEESGYSSPLRIDGVSTQLGDVVEFAIHAP